jgi:hypothetical protein
LGDFFLVSDRVFFGGRSEDQFSGMDMGGEDVGGGDELQRGEGADEVEGPGSGEDGDEVGEEGGEVWEGTGFEEESYSRAVEGGGYGYLVGFVSGGCDAGEGVEVEALYGGTVG